MPKSGRSDNLCPNCNIDIGEPQFETRPVSEGNSPATAAEKKRIYRDWVRFISHGFQRSQFHKDLYDYLILHHGDYAHYSQNNYYDTYFSTPEGIWEFIEWFSDQTRRYNTWGSNSINTYAWNDLSNAMQDALDYWVRVSASPLSEQRKARAIEQAQAILAKEGLKAEVKPL
jgi:hypothetical protein